MKPNKAHIFCNDGTKLSVQASQYHYCSPRNDRGPYTAVEMGYPSTAPTGPLLDLAEDLGSPTQTVYPYVPIQLIHDFIEAHGGIAIGQLPPTI